MAYIETRPEAIKAIKQTIEKKWNPICMGCGEDHASCSLCDYDDATGDRDCQTCPLVLRYGKNANCCPPYTRLDDLTECGECPKVDCCDNVCPTFKDTPEEAEAMLEALVMLLPPEHRKEYGG